MITKEGKSLPSIRHNLRWGYEAYASTEPDGVYVSLTNRSISIKPIWRSKIPYSGGEAVYNTYHTKIVFGISGNSLYVRGEDKTTRPRERFGPATILKWDPPGLQCTGNVCCDEKGYCFAMGAASLPPTMLIAPMMTTPVILPPRPRPRPPLGNMF